MRGHVVVTTTVALSLWMEVIVPTIGSASDQPACHGHPATIVGTEGDDATQGGGTPIYGTPDPDVIVGLGGHDHIVGMEGDDIICGGPGSDDLYGHLGNDMIYGGGDNDSLEGNSGSDALYLGTTGVFAPWWEDTLRDGNIACGDCTWDEGAAGNDTIIGGPGVDGCITSKGPWQGAEWVSGGAGDDYVVGRGSDDCLNAQSGDDIIVGGRGDDSIDAGPQAVDLADGGRGYDRCIAATRTRCEKR